MRWLEWQAAVFGMLGSLLLALRIPPAWGFMAYLVSNVTWIVVARRKGIRALIVQQGFFMATTLLGLWNWLIGPNVLRGVL